MSPAEHSQVEFAVRARTPTHGTCCFIAPPDLLARLAEEGSGDQRQAAIQTMAASASMRAQRSLLSALLRDPETRASALTFITPSPEKRRSVHDVGNQGRSALPGQLVRGEGDSASSDEAVNEAYDGAGATYDFYLEKFGRNSIDGNGMELISSVHYGMNFDNAFWNGAQMVYGDGSGRIFIEGGLTKAIDVIAHELTHGVTEFTAGLEYSKQSGALNESFSDVFGSLVKQHSRGQTADQADWLIGEGIFVPELGSALRSMKEPGTAYDGDPQPAHMRDYKDLPDDNDPANDNGGVHINSGIPNKAFQLAATAIGGNAWEKAGQIWYTTLTTDRLEPTAGFTDAAEATIAVAGELFTPGASEQQAVQQAWEDVGVL